MGEMCGLAVPRILVGVLLLSAVGCGGPPRGQVEGVVRRHGKPLGNVLVAFVPDGDSGAAAGRTDSEGRYQLQGDDGQPGAVVGTYRVTVEDLAIHSAPRDSDGTVLRMPPTRVPARYTTLLQTPIRKQVMEGDQRIDLELLDQ